MSRGLRPLIMGVLNLTPDSFSDGGALPPHWQDPGAACARAEALVADGADLIDLGAESTRPGAKPVPEAEEWARLSPVLSRLTRGRLGAGISVDTRKPALMLRAAAAGATVINDVGGAAPEAVPDEVLRKLAGMAGMRYICMHMHGEPETMQKDPLPPARAAAEVTTFFAARSARLLAAGFAAESVWLDPGIGFGKTDAANVRLMAEIPHWRASGYQIAVGVSRKGFIGRSLGIPTPADRDAPSKTLELGLALLGAGMIRTHDVARLRSLLDLAGSSTVAPAASAPPPAGRSVE